MESERKKPVDSLPPTPLQEPEEGIFEAYANMVDADWTLTDVTLRFMQMIYIPNDDAPTITNRELVCLERANVTLPWYQIKNLATLLVDLVRSYESVNAELKPLSLPPSPRVAKILDDHAKK
jgi:hypothetical protein